MKFILAALFICVLFSCKKEPVQQDQPNKSLLIRAEVTNYDGTKYTYAYQYDNEEKLKKLVVSSTLYNWSSVTELRYDSSKRLSRILYYQINDSGNVSKSNHDNIFLYDAQNRVKEIRYVATSPSTSGGDNHLFAYDHRGRLIADSSYSTLYNQVYSYLTFQYDQSNNIIQWNEYGKGYQGGLTLGYTYTADYDQNLNPYANLGIISYFINGIQPFGLYNKTKLSREGDSPYLFIHETDGMGRVIKTVTYHEAYPNFAFTTRYFYQ